MTVSLERIRQRLSPRFPEIEQVADSVLRFERKSHGRPYAVCYVDVSTNIPQTAEALNDYQEAIVARRYFDGKKSLQWSNYLYFVVDVQPPQKSKANVERDRKYARKLILTEPELDAVLAPPSFQVSDEAVRTDILATWTNILAAARLDRAILNDEPLPRRLELIEASFGQSAMAVPASSVTPRQAPQPFLRRIVLRNFRPFPVRREYDLGTVTLISGPNGTGKTSIIEAIELVYCGRMKRNPRTSNAYTISATYADGRTENATNYREASLFRDRNLAWYGQSEQRTNNLFQAFSRFNFLNTDAAVRLAEDEDNLEEHLSKLLVGPDASKTWREIERTAEKIDEELKKLGAVRNHIDLEMASLTQQIAVSGQLKQESGAVLKKLDELLARVRWERPKGDSVLSVKELVEALSEYEAAAKEAVECDWAGAPVALSGLRQFVTNSSSLVEKGDKLIKELNDVRDFERRANQKLSRIEENLKELTELSTYVDAGLPQRLAEIERLKASIAIHQQVTAGFDDELMRPHLSRAATISASAFAKSASEHLEDTKRQLTQSQKLYSTFNALRDESVALAQRLREIASHILANASEPDTCPLCRTPFQAGELSKHIHLGVDPKVEEHATTLLGAIRQNEAMVEAAAIIQSAAQWAVVACERLGEPASLLVSRLMVIVSDGQRECTEQVQTCARLGHELAQLQKTGMTPERYQHLLTSISGKLESSSTERITAERVSLEQERELAIAERDGHKKASREKSEAVVELLAITGSLPATVDSTLAQQKERLVATQGVLVSLEQCVAHFPCPADQPLSDLAVSIGSVRRLASDFQATIANEQNALTILAEASSRKAGIEKQLVSLVPRIERFVEAREVLTTIQGEHSLAGAMEEALKQNRSAIEAIFSRIHSPAEFSGLGDTLTTLKRKDGGTATLQEISTGQRAAFALSLFLAQNAQLRTAPPLILIDDPIAHVDDLNCLSFLDYLREVVVTGERQVFFATANEKLAVLFERKFDFLGEEFRRYDLSR